MSTETPPETENQGGVLPRRRSGFVRVWVFTLPPRREVRTSPWKRPHRPRRGTADTTPDPDTSGSSRDRPDSTPTPRDYPGRVPESTGRRKEYGGVRKEEVKWKRQVGHLLLWFSVSVFPRIPILCLRVKSPSHTRRTLMVRFVVSGTPESSLPSRVLRPSAYRFSFRSVPVSERSRGPSPRQGRRDRRSPRDRPVS